MAKKDTETLEVNEKTFNKSQLVSSKRYFTRRDLLNSILKDDKKYSFKEVDKMIEDFMRKKVK